MMTIIAEAVEALPDVHKQRIKSGIEVLDIACGCCSYWYDLYRTIKFEFIDGIDETGTEIFFDKTAPDGQRSVKCGSYKHYMFECNNISKTEPTVNEEDFDSIFRRDSNSNDAFSYVDQLIEQGTKYDFVILSNFLHLIDVPLQPKVEMLKNLPMIINDGGFVFLYGNNPMNEEEDSVRPRDRQIEEYLLPMKPVVQKYPGSNLYSLLLTKN